MKIAVFDSGLGSLSIINAIQKKTKCDIVYLADKKNFPYGKKTKRQLYKIITETIEKISARFEPDLIVLASNTPSLLFADRLPKNVITVLPPLQKIQKARNVAILATQVVTKSSELDDYINQFKLDDVTKINCSELINLVESGQFLKNEKHFCFTYGDGLVDLDLKKLIKFHISHKKVATLTAAIPEGRYGHMSIENKRVKEFREKNKEDNSLVNGGFFVFSKDIFDYIEDDYTILEKYTLPRLASVGELMAYRHKGFWQAMDTLRDKDHLNNLWNNNKAPWKNWD